MLDVNVVHVLVIDWSDFDAQALVILDPLATSWVLCFEACTEVLEKYKQIVFLTMKFDRSYKKQMYCYFLQLD